MSASHPFKVIANDNFAPSILAPKLRFARIQDLNNGEVVGLLTETDLTFEETALFDFASQREPDSALAHPDAPMAAEAGARRANICTQEIRIEFSDSALYEAEDIAPAFIESFFSRGFRIGIDATRTWETPFTAYMATVVEAVRVSPHLLQEQLNPQNRVDAAFGSGAMIYAASASWQDAEDLADLGIGYAANPRLNG